jgi:hypothetical protein
MCMLLNRFLVLVAVLVFTLNAGIAYAQTNNSIFRQDATVAAKYKIFANSNQQAMPWSGGVNSPQFGLADFNKDGKNDLVIFEPGAGVRTFVNTGTTGNANYVYDPAYEQYFPVVRYYMLLVDYDRDGAQDLFHYGVGGMSVCRGYYDTKNILNFFPAQELKYTEGSNTNMLVLDVNTTDVPGIVDLDKDGDLDIVTFYLWGAYLYMYRNMQVENGLPPATFRLKLADRCWGRVFQDVGREHMLGFTCNNSGLKPESANKTTHGSNALCLFDYDADSDIDYFVGNGTFSDIQFLKNGKKEHSYGIDTMIAQDTAWSSGGKKLYMSNYPQAAALDIDGDNDTDLLFSPHGTGTENYRCIAYYKNTGTATAPSYAYQSDSFLVDQMIDAGTGSYPMLYDYNKDGKQDLFVGSEGYFQPNGTFRSRLSYYENTSTGTDISFTLRSKDFLNISSLGVAGTIPATGDIDRDGKDDLLIGKLDGTILLYRNQAASAANTPDWKLIPGNLKDNAGAEINVGGFAAPFIYDIDKDGQKDLIIGGRSGSLTYYKNVSPLAGQLALEYRTDTLGGVNTALPFSAYGYSVPFIGKLDNTGKEYLLLGSQSGALYRYDGFQTGNTTGSYTRLDSLYSDIRIKGEYSAPFVADLDGDNKYEMIIGNVLGGLYLYSQLFNSGIDGTESISRRLEVFPNPATDEIFIANASAETAIKVYNSMGQSIHVLYTALGNQIKLDISSLPPGIYMISATGSGTPSSARFVKNN